jgi:hypothetical protein
LRLDYQRSRGKIDEFTEALGQKQLTEAQKHKVETEWQNAQIQVIEADQRFTEIQRQMANRHKFKVLASWYVNLPRMCEFLKIAIQKLKLDLY